jgi:hypothetical protein
MNPILSLIICSRNDQYMGNSRWRLETSLNYVAQKVRVLGREEDVEVIVADWGSEIPLCNVLQLNAPAAKIVSFLCISPEIARVLQQDSPFPEVLALNAAARRAKGQYIGRIDQDTLVGRRFLSTFFELHEERGVLDVPLDSALLFANRRSIPYRFAVRCPSFWAVDRFVLLFGRLLRVETIPPIPFYCSEVGVWLLHRNLWNACGGYDERFIFMEWQEVDMILRLAPKHTLINLGEIVDHDFYHLDHCHPRVPGGARRIRKTNPVRNPDNPPREFNPNSEHWGLIEYPLRLRPYSPTKWNVDLATKCQPRLKWPSFALLLVVTGGQIAWDRLIKSLAEAYSVWKRRARIAWSTVRGRPLVTWPGLVKDLWVKRPSRQRR